MPALNCPSLPPQPAATADAAAPTRCYVLRCPTVLLPLTRGCHRPLSHSLQSLPPEVREAKFVGLAALRAEMYDRNLQVRGSSCNQLPVACWVAGCLLAMDGTLLLLAELAMPVRLCNCTAVSCTVSHPFSPAPLAACSVPAGAAAHAG